MIRQSVITVCIIIIICWFQEPLWFIFICAVHKCFLNASRLQCVFSFAVPVLHLQLDLGALVQLRTFFKLVQEVQHLLVYRVDLSADALTLTRQIEQEGVVVFGGDHKRVWLYGSSISEELCLTDGSVDYYGVVGLAFLQCAIDEDMIIVNRGTHHVDNEQ